LLGIEAKSEFSRVEEGRESQFRLAASVGRSHRFHHRWPGRKWSTGFSEVAGGGVWPGETGAQPLIHVQDARATIKLKFSGRGILLIQSCVECVPGEGGALHAHRKIPHAGKDC